MKIDILTLFPKMFSGPFDESIIKRAKEKGLVNINLHNLRKWASDERGTVDDRPYGGGAGMILRVDVIDKAIEDIKNQKSKIKSTNKNSKIILLDARGGKFTQRKAVQLSRLEQLILIAGHYEGVDHRVAEHIADDVISIGDYVLTGGELPAMVITDVIVRLIPGVIDPESLKEESHSSPSDLEAPQYTRPEVYRGWKVPTVLLSGNHKEIERWRKEKPTTKK
jgi:tRNA (guanine37-N1)-methyltransferase